MLRDPEKPVWPLEQIRSKSVAIALRPEDLQVKGTGLDYFGHFNFATYIRNFSASFHQPWFKLADAESFEDSTKDQIRFTQHFPR